MWLVANKAPSCFFCFSTSSGRRQKYPAGFFSGVTFSLPKIIIRRVTGKTTRGVAVAAGMDKSAAQLEDEMRTADLEAVG